MLGFVSCLHSPRKKCIPLQELRLGYFAKALRDVGERFQILAFSGSVCLPSSGSFGDVGVVVLLSLRDNGGSVLCEPNLQKESAKTICWCGFDFLAGFYLVWDVK
jgi:hypothetical protein